MTISLSAVVRRGRGRDQSEVLGRVAALRAVVVAASGGETPAGDAPFSPRELQLLARPADEWDEQEVVDAAWHGEALGTLRWALQAEEAMPGYDEPFDHAAVAGDLVTDAAKLRPAEELEQARAAARLWHWRARTAQLQADGAVTLPERYATFDQLIAATAMRGYEQGILPAPMRGDFRAYGKVYRHLTPEQHAEAHSLAVERHHALNWLCGAGETWEDVPLDT